MKEQDVQNMVCGAVRAARVAVNAQGGSCTGDAPAVAEIAAALIRAAADNINIREGLMEIWG